MNHRTVIVMTKGRLCQGMPHLKGKKRRREDKRSRLLERMVTKAAWVDAPEDKPKLKLFGT